jgi:hypothetical protein
LARPKDRSERMAIVAQMERKERTKRFLRNSAIGLVVLVLVAGAAYGISKIPPPARTVHWHAKWEVFVNDQQMNFDNFIDVSRNNGGSLYLPAHLHSPSNIIHNEGKEGQGTMSKLFLFHVGGKLTNDEMVLPNGVFPTSGDFKNDGNHTLQMFLDQTSYPDQLNHTSNWHKVADIPNYSFHDGDRILLVYGNDTADQIQKFETDFPTFNPATVT